MASYPGPEGRSCQSYQGRKGNIEIIFMFQIIEDRNYRIKKGEAVTGFALLYSIARMI